MWSKKKWGVSPTPYMNMVYYEDSSPPALLLASACDSSSDSGKLSLAMVVESVVGAEVDMRRTVDTVEHELAWRFLF
jgi:hypothetical protein